MRFNIFAKMLEPASAIKLSKAVVISDIVNKVLQNSQSQLLWLMYGDMVSNS